MPRYEYACTSCGEQIEAVQRITDDPLTVCAACGGPLRKVFQPVGIVFKGSGFYRTDSRNGQPAKEKKAKDAEPKAAGYGSGDTSSADKKPADSAKPSSSAPSKAASASPAS